MSDLVHVILNPASGGGSGAKLAPRVEAELRAREVPFHLLSTTGSGHASDLAQAAAEEGIGRVLAVGGDGTLHEIANGFARTAAEAPSVALLPVGTGNDFSRTVGSPGGVSGAVDRLQHGSPCQYDSARASWEDDSRIVVNHLGLGVDVETLRRREGFSRLSGLAQYLAGLLAAVVNFRSIDLRVTLDDDEVIEDAAIILAFLVGRSMGGGFKVAPRASARDELLDMCWVEALSYLQIARYIPRVIRGTHENLDVVRMRQLKRARIETPGEDPFWFEMDGELSDGPVSSLELEVLPSQLRVLVSEGAR